MKYYSSNLSYLIFHKLFTYFDSESKILESVVVLDLKHIMIDIGFIIQYINKQRLMMIIII